MSYSRFNEGSDTYVFFHASGVLSCCGCLLLSPDDPFDMPSAYFESTAAMLAHLDEHRAAGHAIREGMEQRIRDDAFRNFPAEQFAESADEAAEWARDTEAAGVESWSNHNSESETR